MDLKFYHLKKLKWFHILRKDDFIMKKIYFYIKFIIILFFILLFTFSSNSFAAYPKLISTLSDAFESVETWLIKISTPAAAVAVRDRCIYEKI